MAFSIFFALFGFYIGNIFPTTICLFENFIPWGHSFAFLLVFFNEVSGFFFFRIARTKFYKSFFNKKKQNEKYKFQFPLKQSFFFRCFQFGFLFGLFVDAFKVGS